MKQRGRVPELTELSVTLTLDQLHRQPVSKMRGSPRGRIRVYPGLPQTCAHAYICTYTSMNSCAWTHTHMHIPMHVRVCVHIKNISFYLRQK